MFLLLLNKNNCAQQYAHGHAGCRAKESFRDFVLSRKIADFASSLKLNLLSKSAILLPDYIIFVSHNWRTGVCIHVISNQNSIKGNISISFDLAYYKSSIFFTKLGGQLMSYLKPEKIIWGISYYRYSNLISL